MQPGVDAVKADAAPSDWTMAVEAVGSVDRTSELAVGAAHGLPVSGEAVAPSAPAANGGADHVKRPGPHPRYTEQTYSP